MRICCAFLSAALLLHTFTQANATTKPQFVYVGNVGDYTVSVFSVNNNGTLKPLEPRVVSPICGMPSLLQAAGHVLIVGGEYTNVCNAGELGGGTVYLYPILPSGKLGRVSVSYQNDVESIALDPVAKLAFSSGATLNPHDTTSSIEGWNVSKRNLDTSLPGSPTNFFNFQTGDGLLPGGLAVSSNARFLYGIFSKFSNYNEVGNGQIGVLSLLLDGGIGGFVEEPAPGCPGLDISGGDANILVTLNLKSKTVIYQSCLIDAPLNLPGTPVIGVSIADSSTGKITKTYHVFRPPSGIKLVPVAVDPTGKWLVASNGTGSIDILAINQHTGTLSEPAHHLFNVKASSVAFDHTGRFLYAAQTGKNVVAGFAFDPQAGVVKLPALGTQSTGRLPVVVTVAQP